MNQKYIPGVPPLVLKILLAFGVGLMLAALL